MSGSQTVATPTVRELAGPRHRLGWLSTPGALLVIVGVGIALVFGTTHQPGDVTLVLSSATSLFTISDVTLPAGATIYVLAALTVLAGILTDVVIKPRRRTGVVLFATLMVFLALFIWGVSGESANIETLLTLTVSWSIVLTLGACSGVVSERAGTINVGIEGMMLSGAFIGVVIGGLAGALAGIVGAVVLGGLLGLLLGVAVIRYRADQLIVGIGINILALGLTSYLFNSLFARQPQLNSVDRVGVMSIPVLSDIPIIGPALFAQRPFAYVAIGGALLLHFALRRTLWGLHVNAVGENPQAADAMGIDVHRVRYRNLVYSGCIAGFAGTYLSVGLIGSFTLNMTNGVGFVALAVMIAGRWRPLGALGVALLFGLAQALQGQLANSGAHIPSEFLLMLPYLVTIVVVVGVVGASVAPAADGQPYVKE